MVPKDRLKYLEKGKGKLGEKGKTPDNLEEDSDDDLIPVAAVHEGPQDFREV